jgi:hypothetical protein
MMAEEQASSLVEQDHAPAGPEGSAEDAGDSPTDPHSGPGETIALILLSVTAILTAWCGFEASKWGGEMSIAFSQASSARIEAARQQGIANNARQADLTIYAVYVQAQATNNARLATYVENRFSTEFKVAFDAWVAAGMPTKSPFAMPAYVPPGTTEADAADQRADSMFTEALVNNQRADNYTLLTVLAALVLFFAAVAGRLNNRRTQWVALAIGAVLFVVAGVVAATFPVII